MNPVHVLDEALDQVSHTESNGPVGVALQLDDLIGTATHIQPLHMSSTNTAVLIEL